MLVHILYAKGISFTDYTILGVYSSRERAEQEWEQISSDSKMEGKIEVVRLDQSASMFVGSNGKNIKSSSRDRRDRRDPLSTAPQMTHSLDDWDRGFP